MWSYNKFCYKCTDASKGPAWSYSILYQRPAIGATAAAQYNYCAATNTAFTSWSACACPAGKSRAPGTGCNSGAAFCNSCKKGTYGLGTACPSCPVGKYGDVDYATSCKDCAGGKYSAATKQPADSCITCGAGKYSGGAGKAACTSCPATAPSSNAGSSTRTACYNTAGCGQLIAVKNAAAVPKHSNAKGGTVTVTCLAGFGGGGTATCGSNLKWTYKACTAVTCLASAVPSAKNFKYIGTKTTYKYADVLTTICSPGYRINKQQSGQQTRCTVKDGKGAWEGFPTCAAVECGSPGTTVANGKITATATTFGSVAAKVTCDPGFKGSGTFKCKADTSWETKPVCVSGASCARAWQLHEGRQELRQLREGQVPRQAGPEQLRQLRGRHDAGQGGAEELRAVPGRSVLRRRGPRYGVR